MQKIPTIFERDPANMSRVVDKVTVGCEWIFAGEGRATIKWDGTCCMVRDGMLYKRYELKSGRMAPDDFDPCCDPDPNTGKQPGWVPVGDGPEDQWHCEAFRDRRNCDDPKDIPNGTYELVGPKVQGNPYLYNSHTLYPHGSDAWQNIGVLTFQSIRLELDVREREGIVWHHPDGRMAKIKRRDFGLRWPI